MSKLTNPEIDQFEHALGHQLPGLYRTLLFELGHGKIGSAAEIYHPLNVRDLYEPFFDNPEQLFRVYFPFGCQNTKQELWVIDVLAERAATIWHETVPDDWPEEKWLEYDQWILTYLEPEVSTQ